jgi:nucleoredoxin
MDDEQVICDGDTCSLVPKSANATKPVIHGKLPLTGHLNSVYTLWDDSCTPISSTEAAKRIENKVVGLYFSAQWCPPCRAFSPVLSSFLQRNSDRFVVIYVSMDKNLEKMKENVAGKGWLCIPFDDDVRKHLASTLNVSSIPSLIVLDKNGRPYEKVVSRAGRTAILRNGETCMDEWERGECQSEANGDEQLTLARILMAVRLHPCS